MVGVSADVAENTFHEIVAVLRDLCPANRYEAEKRWTKKEPSWKPDALDKIIIDSFETPLPRPCVKEKQQQYYSGKKERHTIKTQVVTDQTGEIHALAPGHRGPMADKRVYEASDVEALYLVAQKRGALAYLGLPGGGVPHKKPCQGELTDAQKADNRVFASGRVPVEHGIRRIKAFRILRDEYRLGTGLFSMIASANVGLVQLIRLVG